MPEVVCVTRIWQSCQNGGQFDRKFFKDRVAIPVAQILKSITKLIVVVNGDEKTGFAELPGLNGKYPTAVVMAEFFPKEISSGKILVVVCNDWGLNRGSARAINYGIKQAVEELGRKPDWILCWSSELATNPEMIDKALEFGEKNNLAFVSFLREGYDKWVMWKIAQNTGTLYRYNVLEEVNFFSPRCDGDSKKKVEIEFGLAPIQKLQSFYNQHQGEKFLVNVAGMEDFHAQLRMLKNNKNLSWGSIGKNNPVLWEVYNGSDEARLRDLANKIERQRSVAKIYAQEIFPGIGFQTILGMLFKNWIAI